MWKVGLIEHLTPIQMRDISLFLFHKLFQTDTVFEFFYLKVYKEKDKIMERI